MGFLELENINTLELFLTDKGKELMLRENGQGLFDLINQFSLDDRDYDYRRASSVWATGQSASPPGPGPRSRPLAPASQPPTTEAVRSA